MDPYPQWMLCVILLLLYALLSAGRASLTMLSDALVKKMSTSENRRERLIADLLGHPANLTDGLRLAELFCAVYAAVSCYTLLWKLVWGGLVQVQLSRSAYLFSPREPGWTLTAAYFLLHLLLSLVVAFLLDLLCRRLPKRIAAQHARTVALTLAPLCRLASRLFYPFVRLHNLLASLLARPFGAHKDAAPEQVTEEEIRLLVDVGQEKGEIEQTEKDMINNIFEFDDRYVSEVMTHRTDMLAVPVGAALDEVVQQAIESGYSRIPVYEDGVDKITGILYVKDLLALVGRQPEDFSLRSYLREVLFIPENMSCVDLFALFKLKKVQIAVAVDEYGGTAGVVSMEDLLEAIVGNIQDEYDDEEEEIVELSPDCYQLDGALAISDVERLFDLPLDEEDESEYDTIGGLITDALGRLPGADEHPVVELSGIRFTVLLVEERRVVRVKAERMQPEDEEEK